jgi:hypothetical protein
MQGVGRDEDTEAKKELSMSVGLPGGLKWVGGRNGASVVCSGVRRPRAVKGEKKLVLQDHPYKDWPSVLRNRR